MKKSGFTLIELLAVIVILAVVISISIPAVSNIIETSKKKALESSAYGLVNAANLYYTNSIENEIESEITFTCTEDGCVNGAERLELNGVVNGTVKINSSGQVYINISSGEYNVIKNYAEKEVTLLENDSIYNTSVYDDWKTWLYLAGVENPEIYVGQDILSNSTLMETVMASEAAADYMVNSTYWIMPAVLNNEIAVTKLGQSTYASYKAVINTTWKNAIIASNYVNYFDMSSTTVPTMTSNTAPTGVAFASYEYSGTAAWKAFDKTSAWLSWGNTSFPHTVGYKFVDPVLCYKVELTAYNVVEDPTAFVVQGSNDGSTWTDCSSTINPTWVKAGEVKAFSVAATQKYLYYRLYITAGSNSGWSAMAELQFYCK